MTTAAETDRPATCCAPLSGTPLDAGTADRLAQTLKAVADPTRLRLLSLVASFRDGEACICDLTAPVALTQPTVSHHMRVLVDAGLLTRTQRGKWAYYRLADGALEALTASLTAAVTGAPASF
ncbi:MAG TPA: metalloregulator ArsR/SmtB family transcription factor [Pseudonocardiaceae bacterium]